MTENYLGEFDVDIANSEFKDYTPAEWALYYVGRYGGIDGAHHKDWVMDQVARILRCTEVIVKEARWGTPDNIENKEFRVTLGEPSEAYKDWVKELKSGEDGPDTYGYDEGIAP